MPHILIADDEHSQRMFIRKILSTDPTLTFTETKDGIETLESMRREHPDLVVLDILMPRIDWLTICRLLKADPLLCRTPIILVSAMYPISDEDRTWIKWADGFLRKPFAADKLHDMVYQGIGHVQATTNW